MQLGLNDVMMMYGEACAQLRVMAEQLQLQQQRIAELEKQLNAVAEKSDAKQLAEPK